MPYNQVGLILVTPLRDARNLLSLTLRFYRSAWLTSLDRWPTWRLNSGEGGRAAGGWGRRGRVEEEVAKRKGRRGFDQLN